MTSGIDRYDYAFDPDGEDWPARLLRQVPAAGSVLELGPGTGAMTKVLLARGQAVTVVENDPESVALLQELDCQVIVADLDGDDWAEQLAGRTFDAILACDVLEHLKHPEQVLRALRKLAAPQCSFVISMPNIAYAGVVAGLCQGLFEYGDKGVLDRTHLKFFTRRSFERLLHEHGWAPLHWEGNEVGVQRSEFVWQWQALPATLQQFLAAAPYSDVYQWMAVAVPVEDALAAGVRQARCDARQARHELHQLQMRHEAEHASLLEHQKAFAEARRTIADQAREQEQAAEQIAAQAAQLAAQDKQLAAQDKRLAAQDKRLAAQDKRIQTLHEKLESLGNHGFFGRSLRSLWRRVGGSRGS
ncbi:MAG: class I SAM-dependent methyltransferase [Ottowia sp.]|nr:class I SAM-dependent methyltransferase [Ottowia sp.]